MTQNEDR